MNEYQMSALKQASNEQLLRQATAKRIPGPADFYSLLFRIREATNEAREAKGHASNISDTMFGYKGEACGTEPENDRRIGLIGEYEDAIDELFSQLAELRSHLRRISNGVPDMPKATLG